MRSVCSRLSDASATSLDVRGPAVQPGLLAAFDLEAELRRDHDAIANRRERFADELFVRERPVHFGGVEERDAAVDGRADEPNARLLVDAWPNPKLRPMQPKPSAETSSLLVPSVRFCIGVLELEPGPFTSRAVKAEAAALTSAMPRRPIRTATRATPRNGCIVREINDEGALRRIATL